MTTSSPLSPAVVTSASDTAARAIPPVWPLASSVAVNPYLGQTGESLAQVGARLARVGGVPVTMPRAHYNALITDGTITDADITEALEVQNADDAPDLAEVKRSAAVPATPPCATAHHCRPRRLSLWH